MRTNQILLTRHILPNQLIFGEIANFCLLSYLLSNHHQAADRNQMPVKVHTR